MTLTLQPLASASFRRVPWKNGGGVAIDIADAGAGNGWQNFGWRFSRTSITQPGPFSDLTGYQRMQAVIGGSGLVLVTPDGEIDLRKAFHPVRYDGGTPITTRLENGAVDVINLFAEKAAFAMDMIILKAGEAAVLKAGVHVVYAPDAAADMVLGGQATALPGGDAVKCETGDSVSVACSGGLVIVASLFPA